MELEAEARDFCASGESSEVQRTCVARLIFTLVRATLGPSHTSVNVRTAPSRYKVNCPPRATRHLSQSTVKATYAPPVTYTNMLTPLERPLTIGDVRVTFMTRSQVD